MSKHRKHQNEPIAAVEPGVTAEHTAIGEVGIPVHDDQDDQDVAVLDQVSRALTDADDRYLRLAAEYDNYRRRTAKEKLEASDRGAASLLMRLIDELDDVDRLAATDPATTTYESYRNGFALFQRKLRKELESAGLEWIEPAGELFDPSIHEAVAALAPESPEQDHIVKATFQAGYRYKGMVLRPARVQVYSEQGAR